MDKPVSTPIVYLFEHFRLDKQTRQFTRLGAHGEAVPILLGARALDILLVLVEHSGRVVSKARIMDAVWPGLAVEDSNLTVQVTALRRALDDGRHGPSLIQTVHARGYLLTATVRRVIPPPMDTSLAPGHPAGAAQPPPPSDAHPNPRRLSAAVAVLRNLGVAKEHEHLVENIGDDITAILSQFGMSVIACAGAQFRVDGPRNASSPTHEPNVGYVIQGSVRGAADGTAVNMQLIEVETGVQRWSERFALAPGGTTDARDEITHRVAWSLFTKLIEDVNRRIEALPPENIAPGDLIFRGWALLFRPMTAGRPLDAIAYFEQALAADPALISARLGLASALAIDIVDWGGPAAEHDEARLEQLLLDTLRINVNIAGAHFLMGMLRRFQGRLNDARIELEIAIELIPNYSYAIAELGVIRLLSGDPNAAIPLIERSLRLAPHDFSTPLYRSTLGLCHLLLGNIESAITSLRMARALNPSLYYSHLYLAAALALKGELDEANAALRQAIKIKPNVVSGLDLFPRWKLYPEFVAPFRSTVYAGLRLAGLPEQ